VVQQAARRGDQHLDAGLEGQRLRFHVDTAEDHRRAQLRVLGVLLDVLGHLVGQLARGRQHQRAHRVPGWRHAGVLVPQHLLQQRQIVKAAVLPVPVWAAPMMSRPASTRGIALAWIGVIAV
jgi:hypothetical protein